MPGTTFEPILHLVQAPVSINKRRTLYAPLGGLIDNLRTTGPIIPTISQIAGIILRLAQIIARHSHV